MGRRNKKHRRRIDYWECGNPVWTTAREKKHPRPKVIKPVRPVIDGRVTLIAQEVIRDSEKAFLMRIDNKKLWIPKSQMSESDRRLIAEGDLLCELTIPEWLARVNDLL